MGVLGFTPFLQRTCPHVIKRLPDRLKSLRETTIVIDGTLITQRLHFAPMPHKHRHVLGWYRTIREFKDNNVRAICVFDGKERNIAKSREANRRREVRRVDIARRSIEMNRLSRLRKLNVVLSKFCCLEAADREKASINLNNIVMRKVLSSSSSGDQSLFGGTRETFTLPDISTPQSSSQQMDSGIANSLLTVHETPCFLSSPVGEIDGAESRDGHDISALPLVDFDYAEAGLHNVFISDIGSRAVALDTFDESFEFSRNQIQMQDELSYSYSRLHQSFSKFLKASSDDIVTAVDDLCLEDRARSHDSSSSAMPASHLPTDVLTWELSQISSALSTMYLDFRRGATRLTSLLPSSQPLVVFDTASDAAEARMENAMSKSQFQLTIDEGKIWDQLAQSSKTPESAVIAYEARATLIKLVRRSSIISESYARRTNPPSAQTYEESKEIVRALGVPCIETSGPYEAETLASSLVVNGYADYVASEDTDVLVYEAPLIRNIANRDGPLVIVSGADVRSALDLNRSSYIDFALLLGTDFSQRIKNVGPQRALKFIREYGSIERLVEKEQKYPPRIPVSIYLEQVEAARSVFQTLPPVPDAILLQPTEENLADVMAILKKYDLLRIVNHSWDYDAALDGNYFDDDPSAT